MSKSLLRVRRTRCYARTIEFSTSVASMMLMYLHDDLPRRESDKEQRIAN